MRFFSLIREFIVGLCKPLLFISTNTFSSILKFFGNILKISAKFFHTQSLIEIGEGDPLLAMAEHKNKYDRQLRYVQVSILRPCSISYAFCFNTFFVPVRVLLIIIKAPAIFLPSSLLFRIQRRFSFPNFFFNSGCKTSKIIVLRCSYCCYICRQH